MAKLKFVILKAKPMADGRFNVKLALTHKTKTCYFSTPFNCELRKFKEWSISGDALSTARMKDMYWKYQERLDAIMNHGLYDCKQLFDMVFNGYATDKEKTFMRANEEYIQRLNDEGRVKTAKLFERAGRYFHSCFADMKLKDINPSTVFQFEEWLKKNTQNKETTRGMVISRIKSVVNYETKVGNVSYAVNPFSQYKIKSAPTRDIDLSLEDMRKIVNYQPNTKRKRLVKDLFMLSFYLGGINLVDLVKVDLSGDSISFFRQKTASRILNRKPTILPITPRAREIISRNIGADGRFSLNDGMSYDTLYRLVSKYLGIIKEECGISKKVVFYSARDSFAQYAIKCGFSDSVVNYCLAHSDRSRGILRYYVYVEEEMAKKCLIAVSDYVNC